MWFQAEIIAQALRDKRISREWLRKRLGCRRGALVLILRGEQAADYAIAKGFLEVFGYELIIAAINWGRTKYAGN